MEQVERLARADMVLRVAREQTPTEREVAEPAETVLAAAAQAAAAFRRLPVG